MKLVTSINTFLLLLGIPSYWDKMAIRLLILLGTGLSLLLSLSDDRATTWSN